jgi:hypothetical protein
VNDKALTAAALSPHFRRTVQALVLVSPLAIAARYDDGFGHCVEASVAGAAALRRHGIDKAKPVPCSVLVERDDGASTLTIGYSARQLYDQLEGEKPSFDDWRSGPALRVPDQENPIHEVIRARVGKTSVLIDLTLGQLRKTGTEDSEKIPLRIFGVGDDWLSFHVPPWTIRYLASPHDPQVIARSNANVNKCSVPAFVDDLSDLMDLALKFDLDHERLHAELLRQQPEIFKETLLRLANLSKPRA